jgi:hypothetical protein
MAQAAIEPSERSLVDLPAEVLRRVATCMWADARGLVALACCCRTTRDLCHDQALWKEITIERFGEDLVPEWYPLDGMLTTPSKFNALLCWEAVLQSLQQHSACMSAHPAQIHRSLVHISTQQPCDLTKPGCLLSTVLTLCVTYACTAEPAKPVELEGFVFYQGHDGSRMFDKQVAAGDLEQLAQQTTGMSQSSNILRPCLACTLCTVLQYYSSVHSIKIAAAARVAHADAGAVHSFPCRGWC